MNPRFSKTVMESIRNRELLAQALVEQEQELVRKRRFIRFFCVGAPLAGIFYVLHGPPLMEMDGLKSLAKLQKSIFKQAAAQAQAGGKMMIGEEKKFQETLAGQPKTSNSDGTNTANAYTQTESVDDMVQELEARNAKLQDFSDKHKSNLSQEQLMAMVEKNNQNQAGGAPSENDLKNLSSDLQERNQALNESFQEGIGAAEKPPTSETRALASTAPTIPTCMPLPQEKLLLALPELRSPTPSATMAYQPSTEYALMGIALLAPPPVKSPGTHEYEPVNKMEL